MALPVYSALHVSFNIVEMNNNDVALNTTGLSLDLLF